MNHGTLAAVVFADSGSDEARIGHEIIDSTRAGVVPKAKIMRRQRKGGAHREPHGPPVFRIHIPYVSHGRVTVADVARLWRRDHSLCRPGFRTDHQIVLAEIELLQGEGLKEQEIAMKLLPSWYSLEKRSLQLSVLQNGRECGTVGDQ